MLSYERTPLADKLIQSLDCGAIIKLKHLLFKRKLIEQTNKNRLNELCDNAVCNYLWVSEIVFCVDFSFFCIDLVDKEMFDFPINDWMLE